MQQTAQQPIAAQQLAQPQQGTQAQQPQPAWPSCTRQIVVVADGSSYMEPYWKSLYDTCIHPALTVRALSHATTWFESGQLCGDSSFCRRNFVFCVRHHPLIVLLCSFWMYGARTILRSRLSSRLWHFTIILHMETGVTICFLFFMLCSTAWIYYCVVHAIFVSSHACVYIPIYTQEPSRWGPCMISR